MQRKTTAIVRVLELVRIATFRFANLMLKLRRAFVVAIRGNKIKADSQVEPVALSITSEATKALMKPSFSNANRLESCWSKRCLKTRREVKEFFNISKGMN